MLISDDLPTFDLPMKANSRSADSGQPSRSGELISKVADWICMTCDGLASRYFAMKKKARNS